MIAPRTSRALNAQTELTTRGNLLQGPLPRPGTWELGETGIDSLPEDPARGRTQVRREDVDEVRCDIVREHARSLTVETVTGERAVMIAADSLGVLRTIAAHVGRDRLVDVNAAG